MQLSFFSKIKSKLELLSVRFLLIIVLPPVILQIVTAYFFYERHWVNVSRHRVKALADDVALLVNWSETLPLNQQKNYYYFAAETLHFGIKITENIQTSFVLKEEQSSLLTLLEDTLAHRIFFPFSVAYSADREMIHIIIYKKHEKIQLAASLKRLENPTTYIFILWVMGTSLVLLCISLLISRNQIRAIIRLAEAADAFGKGLPATSFVPEGAREVRRAGMAFLRMKKNIERQIKQRTDMLAGVSHDLRTPLTRIKLQLALLPETKDIEDMGHDVEDMEKMIEGYLNFARGESGETEKQINVSLLTQNIAMRYTCLTTQIEPHLTLQAKKNALQRALQNILNNAAHYGTHIHLTVRKENDFVIFIIDDNGPGIPEASRKDVFRPFFRMDHARKMHEGSVGLGLTIARDIINHHGGTIRLTENEGKGLRVVISLPA